MFNYISKVKLDRGQSPDIFSEIIILGEHGGCAGNFPISHFLMSLAHSALAVASREREHFKPSLTDLFSGGVEWFGETGRQLFPAFTGGNSPTFILNICSFAVFDSRIISNSKITGRIRIAEFYLILPKFFVREFFLDSRALF